MKVTPLKRRGLRIWCGNYYPFGLTMAGISSKALNSIVENKRGYNGNELQSKEFFDQSGLEFYDFNARSYDQQVGRFMQVDPTPEDGSQESLSPYHFTGNNPIRYEDANGKCAWCDVVYEGAVGAARTINTYINPLTPLVELVTGKSVESDFTVPKPRLSSAVEAGISLIPGGKIEGAVAKQLDRAMVKEGAEAAEKQVVKYEVGTANNLKNRSVPGDNLDIHHVSQSKPAGQLIPGYDRKTAPAIALPREEHKVIKTLKGTNTAGNARQQLAKDIRDLRQNTSAPISSLEQLIDLNKKLYPEAFRKKN